MAEPLNILPVFKTRDFVFIADLAADIAWTFNFDGDDLMALLTLCWERLEKTNNRFNKELFEKRMEQTFKSMIENGVEDGS